MATRDVEEPSLEFEEWPNTALIKTYCRSSHCIIYHWKILCYDLQ